MEHNHVHGTGTGTFEQPERSRTALDVDIDGHCIVYDTADRSVRLLDPIGALIWSVLDGNASVDELTDDLSAAFAVPRDQLVTDIANFIHQLGHEGLLAGSRALPPELLDQEVVLPNPPSP